MPSLTRVQVGTPSSGGSAQDAFNGSVSSGKATPDVLTLSLKDAIERGLRQNLGALLTEQNVNSATAQRWRSLAAVLPSLSGAVTYTEQQINLQAMGFSFPKTPGSPFANIPNVIGPFGVVDARAYTSANLSLASVENIRSAMENVRAAKFSYQNALELVVFAVSNAYLQVLASGTNVTNAEAQVATAQALVNQAEQMHQAGVTAKIDSLRAAVELQARQQDLIVAKNNLEKSKIVLARTIGLAPEQQFQLADSLQYIAAPAITQEEALHRAYQARLDYRQAEAQVRAATDAERAAHLEHMPSIAINGNYGDIGLHPSQSHGTFVASGGLEIPIYAGGRVKADVMQARSELKQNQDRLADLEGRIDAEIRTAILDVNAAAEQVRLAGNTVKLAEEELSEARDRFAAGVTDNLEVVQAQGSLVGAQNQYVASLYIHSLAKLTLARALGEARQNAATWLGGK
jgi:outer membrane protein TolC